MQHLLGPLTVDRKYINGTMMVIEANCLHGHKKMEESARAQVDAFGTFARG